MLNSISRRSSFKKNHISLSLFITHVTQYNSVFHGRWTPTMKSRLKVICELLLRPSTRIKVKSLNDSKRRNHTDIYPNRFHQDLVKKKKKEKSFIKREKIELTHELTRNIQHFIYSAFEILLLVRNRGRYKTFSRKNNNSAIFKGFRQIKYG